MSCSGRWTSGTVQSNLKEDVKKKNEQLYIITLLELLCGFIAWLTQRHKYIHFCNARNPYTFTTPLDFPDMSDTSLVWGRLMGFAVFSWQMALWVKVASKKKKKRQVSRSHTLVSHFSINSDFFLFRNDCSQYGYISHNLRDIKLYSRHWLWALTLTVLVYV